MLLSRRSKRLLHCRWHGPPERETHSDESGLDRLDDQPADQATRWSVFGFTWTVPGGFLLEQQELSAGSLRFEFRHRRERLSFLRTLAAGNAQMESPEDRADRHLGHPLNIGERKLPFWCVLTGGRTVKSARWQCPSSARSFEVISSCPKVKNRLLDAVRGVACHAGGERR